MNMPFDYLLRKNPESQELILLLHGYSQSGSSIFKQLESALPSTVNILSPNALFPLPKRREGKGHLFGYSWYVYDFASADYVMDMRYAIEFLTSGLQKLGLSKHKKTLIGFSQGGYLAPLLAEDLGDVHQVIGIGCEFLHEEFRRRPDYPLHAIHGELDEVVKFEAAQFAVNTLISQGISAQMHAIPDAGHEINDAVRAQVRAINQTA